MPGDLVVERIHPADERWSAILARAAFDVYDTEAYVRAEAHRLGAEAVGCLVDDGARVFLLPLLVRPVGNGSEADLAALDAVSPYGYPGIVLAGTDVASDGFVDDCLVTMLDALRDAGICSAFVRLHPLLNAELGPALRRQPVTENGFTVSIDLTLSEQGLWSAMSKGHTNAINKARRCGFTIEIAPARQLAVELAATYADTMRRLGAAEPYEFSADPLGRLAAMDEAFVAVARADGAVAGAYLFFECQGIIQAHLGGPRSAYMRPSASHLLIHSIARWGKARGDAVMHLGGGVGGSVHDSLFSFKAGFSPRRHRYQTLRLVADESRYGALLREKARRLGEPPRRLVESGFFPAYRATVRADG